MRSSSVLAVLVSLSLTSVSWGQGKQPQVDELRRQMEALQKQIEALESKPAAPSKTTQLSATPRRRVADQGLIVRVYDLSDLFTIAPTYTATIGDDVGLTPRAVFPETGAGEFTGMGGGMGGMGLGGAGGGFFAVPSGALQMQRATVQAAAAATTGGAGESAKTSIEQLIDSIKTTIAPENWSDAGGPGSIAQLGTSLIISADANAHEQIEALLSLLRQRWGTLRTVSVNAWWADLDDRQLAQLLPGNGKGETGIAGVQAFGVVEDAAWQKLFGAQVPEEERDRFYYQTILTCFNGQTVAAVAGGEEGVVTKLSPVLTQMDEGSRPYGRVGYRPTFKAIQEGVALQITPRVNTSGKVVILDIHSRLAVREPAGEARPAPEEDEEEDKDASPAAVVAAIDRPRLLTQRISTTLRVPVERIVLVGGTTVSSKLKEGERPLYLFVRATVQELRDDTKPGVPQPEPGKDEKPAAGQPELK